MKLLVPFEVPNFRARKIARADVSSSAVTGQPEIWTLIDFEADDVDATRSPVPLPGRWRLKAAGTRTSVWAKTMWSCSLTGSSATGAATPPDVRRQLPTGAPSGCPSTSSTGETEH
jgi:hypothetical protein